MKITKMTATFGGLHKKTLEPAPGLTVIHGPNEGGKSTWAGFLRAMLYGINTRERDKEGFLAEKNRYAPWSGSPMEGEVRLQWRGEDITLRRFAKKTSPFGGFEAVYTATGDPVPELAAESVGEALIGAGREMYERSAFVGQGGTALIGGAELERRIAALAATGEEEVSYTQTERTLKDWANRRRANRTNGIIPRLEEEILRLEEELRAAREGRESVERSARRLQELEEEQRELKGELDIHNRIRQQELDRRYGEAKLAWERAVAAIPREGNHPIFGDMTAAQAWEFARRRAEEEQAALEENRKREEKRRELEGKIKEQGAGRTVGIVCLAAAALCLLATPVILFLAPPLAVILALIGLNAMKKARKGRELSRELDEWEPVPVPRAGDIVEQAARYREELAAVEQAKAAAAAARRLMEELAAQGGREYTTLEYLHPPVRTLAETNARLRQVEQELYLLRRNVDTARGRLDTMGDADQLLGRVNSLKGELGERKRELEALTVAMEALSAANDTLRQRFSPELNRRAGELFARLTGGKYAALTLTRTFDAAATPAGEVLPRAALALSQGTAEQLYLAVRLAICDMTLGGEEPPPIVLDDALANFDDGRMELALELLRELGEKRQILLFSCHSREAQWAKSNGVAVCHL